MRLAIILLAVCLTYIAAFAIGWRLSTLGRLAPDQLFRIAHRFVDPITARFQKWQGVETINTVRKKHWARLWLLISLSIILAVALVS